MQNFFSDAFDANQFLHIHALDKLHLSLALVVMQLVFQFVLKFVRKTALQIVGAEYAVHVMGAV